MATVGEAGASSSGGASRRRGLVARGRCTEDAVLPGAPLVLVDSWHAPGGKSWLGRALPATIGAVALLMLGGAVYLPVHDGPGAGVFPTVLLGSLACLAGWLAWKVVGTVWLVGRALDNSLACCAARRRWLLGPNEILAVKGDAYGMFLVLVTIRGKIWLWGQMGDRQALLAAIRRSNPRVEVDAYAEPRRT